MRYLFMSWVSGKATAFGMTWTSVAALTQPSDRRSRVQGMQVDVAAVTASARTVERARSLPAGIAMRAVACLTGLIVVAGPAQAAPVPRVPVGSPTVWITSPPQSSSAVVLGPNTASLLLLLPTVANEAPIVKDAWFQFEIDQPLDRVSIPQVTADLTIPVGAVVRFGLERQPPDMPARLYVGSTAAPDRFGRVLTATNAIEISRRLGFDPALDAPTVTVDMRTPGNGIRVSYSYHQGMDVPISVRRGGKLVLVSPQAGFFTTGPWGVGFPGSVEATYGSKPASCVGQGTSGARIGTRGCGEGQLGSRVPVTVSADGMTATISFPRTLQPPRAHTKSEIVRLRWVPKGSRSSPGIPGTYEVVREVALK